MVWGGGSGVVKVFGVEIENLITVQFSEKLFFSPRAIDWSGVVGFSMQEKLPKNTAFTFTFSIDNKKHNCQVSVNLGVLPI